MDDSKKFVCKFCDKKFRCGKSLGGHIRIHLKGSLSTRSTYFEEEAKLKINGGQSGYELRENPKKTARFSVNASDSRLVRVCGECGKGFQSLKALCGHMACHSKLINSFDDLSRSEKLKEIGTDSESGNETSGDAIGGQSSSLSMANGSCSVSDIEPEQEEVAMCLMMLSQDSGFKRSFTSVPDPSDNDSVVLEAKPSRNKIKIRTKIGVDCLEKKQAKRKEHSPNSDSRDFSSESTGLELKIPPQGFATNDKIKKPKLELDSGFNKEFDAEFRKRLRRFCRIKTKYAKDDAFAKNHMDSTRQNSTNIHSSNEGGKFFTEANRLTDESSVSNRNLKTHSSCRRCPIAQSSGIIHKCPFCSKVFKSGQALGGHKRSHFVGGIDDDDRSVLVKQEESSLLDLNFPATVEEDISDL